jgi:hypothetical protein
VNRINQKAVDLIKKQKSPQRFAKNTKQEKKAIEEKDEIADEEELMKTIL